MASFQNLSRREKVIMIVTGVLLIALIVYYGFLTGFIEEYQAVTEDLSTQRRMYEQQQKILAMGDRIDKQYQSIAASLPSPEEGKEPAMVFSEEIADLCRGLNIPLPTIQVHDIEPIPNAEGFSYLILPVSGIEGDLNQITRILNGFYEKNMLVRELTIKSPSRRKEELPMTVHVARIIRTEDLREGKGGK